MVVIAACFYCGQKIEWVPNKLVDMKQTALDKHYQNDCEEFSEVYPTLVWRMRREMEAFMKGLIRKDGA